MAKKLQTFCTATFTSFKYTYKFKYRTVILSLFISSFVFATETLKERQTEGDRETDTEKEKQRNTEKDALFACDLEILLNTAMKSSTHMNHSINKA